MNLREQKKVTLPSESNNPDLIESVKRISLFRSSITSTRGMRKAFEGSDHLFIPNDIAIIFLKEREAHDARSWCQIACSHSDLTEIPASLTLSQSNMAAPFDVRIVVGESAEQLVGWLVKSGEYLEWRPSIAAISKAGPKERAYLLRCGFDDVLNISEMDPLEGTLRVSAIWSGFQRYKETIERERSFQRELRRMSLDGKWSWQQRTFLLMLLNSPSGFARYDELGAHVADGSSMADRRYLKVVASQIRRKLSKNYSLESMRHRGYILTRNGERLDNF